MGSKFRFSLEGVDATARQFAEIRRQLTELSSRICKSVSQLDASVSDIKEEYKSFTTEKPQVTTGELVEVVKPEYGGTGTYSAYDNPLSLNCQKPVYCLYDGTLGCDCSSMYSVAKISDADEFVPVDALRQVKWRVYTFKDDLNLNFDDAQPVVGLFAEDLDNAGLGFFCEYDTDGNVTGVDYSRLSVAALRLAQEAMNEVDKLKNEVSRLSSLVGKMGVSTSE